MLLRLREKMVQAEPEEQVNFIIWTLEAASRLAMQQPGGEKAPGWAGCHCSIRAWCAAALRYEHPPARRALP